MPSAPPPASSFGSAGLALTPSRIRLHPTRRSILTRLAEAEAKAAAALQRLNLARETLEREESRARERMSELDGRLVQLAADVEREQRLADDAVAALDRLAAEEATLEQETQATQALRASVAQASKKKPKAAADGAAKKSKSSGSGSKARASTRKSS